MIILDQVKICLASENICWASTYPIYLLGVWGGCLLNWKHIFWPYLNVQIMLPYVGWIWAVVFGGRKCRVTSDRAVSTLSRDSLSTRKMILWPASFILRFSFDNWSHPDIFIVKVVTLDIRLNIPFMDVLTIWPTVSFHSLVMLSQAHFCTSLRLKLGWSCLC